MTKQEPKPWHGVVTFAVTIIYMLFVAYPMQANWGMTGLLLTEVGFLIIAAAAKLIFGGTKGWKDTFSFHKFTFKQLGGAILIYIGAYNLTVLVANITAYLFPQMSEVTSSMSDLFTSVSMPVAFLIIAVSPAICEEILHRGFIQHTLSGIRQKWLQVLLIGLIFGIFHLDPYRFLPTALLGAAFGYILLETKSIFLTMLLHFTNNAISTVASFALAKMQETSPEIYEASLAASSNISVTSLVALAGINLEIALLCLFFGSRLLRNYEANAKGFKNAIIVVIVSVLLFVGGFILNISTAINSLLPDSEALISTKFTAEEMIESDSIDFNVPQDGEYILTVKLKSDFPSYFAVKDMWGVVYEFTDTEREETLPLNLYAGPHSVEYDIDSTGVELEFQITEAPKE